MSVIIYGPNAVSNGTLLADKFQCRHVVVDMDGDLYRLPSTVAGFEVFKAASVMVLTPIAPPEKIGHQPHFIAYVDAIALLGKPDPLAAKKVVK